MKSALLIAYVITTIIATNRRQNLSLLYVTDALFELHKSQIVTHYCYAYIFSENGTVHKV